MVSIAILGTGPSGCFTAQALVKALPDARIDMIDALPVPYGLIRYGVAADHQGTKAVIRQFERLFERHDVRFFGNVAVGDDIAPDDLTEMYDAVVMAFGLRTDRKLGIPGEGLAGVYASGQVTGAWNDLPGAEPAQIGKRVVVIGNGNVAVDLVRVLAKGSDEFHGSDLSLAHTKALLDAGVERIDVVGRSPAAQAKFDPVMLRELGRLAQARISVHGAEGEGKVIEALHAIDGHAPEGATREIVFHFGWTPEALEGSNHVTGARFRRGAEVLALPCDTVLTAIGFTGYTPTTDDAGAVMPGLYATGWYRRGPRGTIPENRADAQQVAARIVADLDGTTHRKPGRDALIPLVPQAVSYAQWQAIDAAERAACPPDRCRQKLTTTDQMLATARQTGDH